MGGFVGTGARCAHGIQRLGQSHNFHPQLDPHREVLHGNLSTQKTARKCVSHEFLAVLIESGLYTTK